MLVKTADDVRSSNRWVVAKSWKPCSSGRIPVLDCNSDCQNETEPVKGKNNWELKRCSGKREASDDIRLLDFSSPKKLKQTLENHETCGQDVSSPTTSGHLMMDGV
ncbi:hypothetical protein PTKIN_Ptkin13bG0254000 [Pterospermum kingtungense]